MNELKKLIVNGTEYALPAGITVACLEALDDDDEQYICTSHTARQLITALNGGTPVIALMRNQGTKIGKQLPAFTEGEDRLVFGDALIDGGWQHFVGRNGFYRDADTGNQKAGNELWIMY